MNRKLTLLVGPSGSGKTTVYKSLVRRGFRPMTFFTTRPKREGEVDGLDYDFVDNDMFERYKMNGRMLYQKAYNVINDNGRPHIYKYGFPNLEIYEGDTYRYVAIVDVNDIEFLVDKYGLDNIAIVYMNCLGDIREDRVKSRDTSKEFNKEEWDRRYADEVAKYDDLDLESPYVRVIDNNGDADTLEKTLDDIFNTEPMRWS